MSTAFFLIVLVLGPPTLPVASEETVPLERTQLNVTRFLLRSYNNSFDDMVEIYLVYLFISAVEILRSRN